MNTAIDAGASVLGAILLKPDIMPDVQKTLSPDIDNWFYEPKHNIVFNQCVAMTIAGEPIDTVTLLNRLESNPSWGIIQDAGGYSYVSELTSNVPDTAHANQYALIVAESYCKRRMVDVSLKLKAGAQNGVDAAETFDAAKRSLDAIFEGRTKQYQADNVGNMFTTTAPEMKFIFDGIVPSDTMGGCDAGGGSGKGMLTQEIITSLCTGKTLLPAFEPTQKRKVLWLQSEDTSDEIHRRFERISTAFGLSESDKESVSENLVLYSQLAAPLNRKDEDGRTIPTQFFNWLSDEVKRIQPGLIVIDPRSHYFSGEENSNSDVAAFMNLVKELVNEVDDGCSVWMNHHASKARQTEQGSDMGRGASAGRDAMRFLFNITCLTKQEIEQAGISNPKLFVKLELSKSNWTAPKDGSIYLRRGTGETGGVLKEIHLDDMVQETKTAVLDQMTKYVANLIGSNRDNITVREIAEKDEGAEIRLDMKKKFGDRGATKKTIREAIENGIETCLIKVRDEGSGASKREVPFYL